MGDQEGTTTEVECSTNRVESSVATAPDDGTPNENKSNNENIIDRDIVREGPRESFRRGGKHNVKMDKSFMSGRRNEDSEYNPSRSMREFPSGPNQAGPRDYVGRERDFAGRERDFAGSRQDQGAWSTTEYYREKLYEISGPTHELAPLDMREKKFNGRNRLYVGNIRSDTTEEEIVKMFSEFGEISDVFVNNEKYFAFVVFDYHSNAERAKHELNGKNVGNDRQLKIRFSPRASTIRVSNLPPTVTNELLFHAFSIFGEVERAIVLIDERGRSTGIGEIDFFRKKSAVQAVKECTEGCFFLTNSLRPCIAEFFEPIQDTEGFGEKNIQWRNGDFLKDREVGPWLAKPNSYEFEFGNKWKQVRELFKEKEEALKQELLIEEEKMYAQMGFAKFEYETYLLKKQLQERELYWEQQKLDLEKKERIAEERRLRNEEEIRRREEQIKVRLARQDEELKMRQRESPYFPKKDRSSARHYDNRPTEDWEERARESYWQQETHIPPADDAISQESRNRNNLLEEPGQVWKRLDDEGIVRDELFHRRSNPIEDEVPRDAEYPNQGQWKRSWPEDYHFTKRGRY